ncbi:hypothetical protein PoB_005965600 [Plakobranchus ocellatus]|uniref:Uncharacterized protein n=1 Tax=Plakobranchus ocellatus TaxID=259542 RepID=A0AAV4CML8_9GAST|nr:hypothetical protein PoB_005965600 [Plakobranchus ocellatus]
MIQDSGRGPWRNSNRDDTKQWERTMETLQSRSYRTVGEDHGDTPIEMIQDSGRGPWSHSNRDDTGHWERTMETL